MYSKTSWSYLHLLACTLMLFSAITALCPQEDEVRTACRCESNAYSTLLDCSNCTGSNTVDMLKRHRMKLGLLAELQLRNCSLVELDANQFNGLFVKKLDLSNNKISTIDIKAFEGLKSILQTLLLRNNQLKEVPNKALNNMDELQHLDISGNHIGDIDENQQLINLPKLTDLNLANNRISSVHKDAFEMIKSTLQTLNLGTNRLSEVPAAAIRGSKNLLALHIQHNQISAIKALQFVNLPTLSLLNLADNNIEVIQRQSFVNVPMVRFLYLSDNNLSLLEPHTFSSLENLELLDITNNRIWKISNDTFSNIPKLTQLYMGDNLVTVIEPYAFTNSSLVLLMLPRNNLTKLEADTLQGLTYLQQLSLKENKISHIDGTAFYGVPNLVVLDLSGNQLEDLAASTFVGQHNLFLLDLSSNRFSNTPYNALNRRTSTVMLQENPLVCTEHIHIIENNVAIHVPNSQDKICKNDIVTKQESPFVIKQINTQKTENMLVGSTESEQQEEKEIPTLPPGIVTKDSPASMSGTFAAKAEPEIIHTFPFLSEPPTQEVNSLLDPATASYQDTTKTPFTGLPAGIITVMPKWTYPPGYRKPTTADAILEKEVDSAYSNSISENRIEEADVDDDNSSWLAFSENAKMTASICVGVVTALTLFVIGLLYYVRRKSRRQSQRSVSSSRTTAFAAAQTYGCYNYPSRGATDILPPRRPSRQCDITTYARDPPNWLYDPLCYSSGAFRS